MSLGASPFAMHLGSLAALDLIMEDGNPKSGVICRLEAKSPHQSRPIFEQL